MNSALRISFALKNAYRVNAILFSLKQIPLIKKLLPASLYCSKGLKRFANVLALLWEVVSAFVGKLLYFATMVCGIGALYEMLPSDAVFLHILLFLSMIGSFANTYLFNPTKDKYYAIVLMRMNAREYTVSNYVYSTVKVVLGFLPFTIVFGLSNGVPIWLCLLLPICISGMKAFFVASTLWNYEKKDSEFSENKFSSKRWAFLFALLAAAYGLPLLGVAMPILFSTAIFLLCIPLGVIGFIKILSFAYYADVNKALLSPIPSRNDTIAQATKKAGEKRISDDKTIVSNRKGFEYLNELFIKRHRKTLWKVAKIITYICLFLFCALQLVMYIKPEIKASVNSGIFSCLPNFLFVMYCINRGTSFTQSLFMNCDHSLLTYSFFKKPSFILKLFSIRLREIMKINLLPALVIGAGLSVTLYTSGGTDNPLNYAILFVSIVCMSLFFSVHYLTLYYLLQPYNAGTELKSATYSIVAFSTYFGCYALMLRPIPTFVFGAMTIAFAVVYCIIACILVYFFAPKTFKLRT